MFHLGEFSITFFKNYVVVLFESVSIMSGDGGCGRFWNLPICWCSSFHKNPRFSFGIIRVISMIPLEKNNLKSAIFIFFKGCSK